MNQRYLILDYETRSEANLRKTGAYEYANHSSTKIMCAAWRLGTRDELREQLKNKEPAKIWSPAFPTEFDSPADLIYHLLDPNIKIVAHNALFEQVMTRFVLSQYKWANYPELRHLSHDRWICTAALAAALALPRNLAGACGALHLPVQKDKEGHRLMMKLCKPRKPSKKNPAKFHNNARDLKRVMQYCQTDVDAETYLFLTVPSLTDSEREIWLLDQKINFRGFQADRKMVDAVLKMMATETFNLNQETKDITFDELISTTQRDGVLQWLQSEGVFLPDLRAKTVKDSITEGIVDGDAKRILQIRQAIAKTSNKKYSAFEARSRTDGRVRDILVYHTASTGRWGGAGLQPHNFPRGHIADTSLAADILRDGDIEFARLVYGNPMDVFSSCLRSVITAPNGRKFICADFAAIEARVLFCVAKHTVGLKAFFDNQPLYEEMACVIHNLENVEDVSKMQRQLGKQTILGGGFGMGWKKFIQTCKNYGIEIDEITAQKAIKAYRETHYPVVELWSNIERAALEAVKRKGTKFTINRTQWWVECLPNTKLEFLWCKLPSGRKLAYFGPQIRYVKTPWDELRPALYHWGVHPITKRWELGGTYGGRLTENVVQAISRDLMASAMFRIEESGYDLVLTVHDEILAECQENRESALLHFEKLMAEIPPWAEGCPVRVEGWEGPRYHK